MSLLNQFPAAPKRGRVIPGNDGYDVNIEPGYKYAQDVIKCAVTVKGRNAYAPTTSFVNFSYPTIKLGANQYMIDLERVDVKAYLDPAYAGDGIRNGPCNTTVGTAYGDKDLKGITPKNVLHVQADGPWEGRIDNNVNKTAVFALPVLSIATSFFGANLPEPPAEGYYNTSTLPKAFSDNVLNCTYTVSQMIPQNTSGYKLMCDDLSFTCTLSDNGLLYYDRSWMPSDAKLSYARGAKDYNPVTKILADVTYNFVVHPNTPYVDSML